MTERVVIPPAEEIEITPRRYTKLPPGEFLPYKGDSDGIPDMMKAGDGYKFHVTGLTHDERGYPEFTPAMQAKLIPRLMNKIRNAVKDISLFDEDTEGAEIVVVSYGITSRVAQRAIDMAKERGIKAGRLRLLTAWPFPDFKIEELATRIKAFVVPELNMGQMSREVQRAANGAARTVPVHHPGGAVHHPEEILEAILEAAR